MMITTHIDLLEQILAEYQSNLGRDFLAYRNHCYRVYHFCSALIDSHAFLNEKLGIAVAFHDLAIWTHHSLDYLPPSQQLAHDYLVNVGWPEWAAEIELMIAEHHKLTPVKNKPLVEAFRQADWVDVSLGVLQFGLSSTFINSVQAAFPNAGFHKRLLQLAGKRLLGHPLSPLPMVKW
ncbi:MAG TPA: hypothetical protein VFM46_07585 [Pseudomonadales bacterium]|nr:hypothetical protein [Pseudomonadales bacterium]